MSGASCFCQLCPRLRVLGPDWSSPGPALLLVQPAAHPLKQRLLGLTGRSASSLP